MNYELEAFLDRIYEFVLRRTVDLDIAGTTAMAVGDTGMVREIMGSTKELHLFTKWAESEDEKLRAQGRVR